MPQPTLLHVHGFFFGATFLDVTPGLSVLYGLNGAGKTRTLQSIQNFYAGKASDAVALVQLPELDDASWNDTRLSTCGAAIGRHTWEQAAR